MYDFLIIGGGVVGLSLAWELAGRRQRVLLVDRSRLGAGTSWVGAGIFPPPAPLATHDPLEQLRLLSHRIHREWSEELRDQTGIDNELLTSGGIYVGRRNAEVASLRANMMQAREDGVEVQELTPDDVVELEPSLKPIRAQLRAAYRLPEEAQLRSPRHLEALIAACRLRGVDLRENVTVSGFDLNDESGRVVGARTSSGLVHAANYCVTGGTWTAELLAPLGIKIPIEPWLGQLIIWKTPRPLLKHVLNEGCRYLVPRVDGHLVAGATIEDVGFECETTELATAELQSFSCGLIPSLSEHAIKGTWAGLRPGTPDGRPFLGRVPGCDNLSIAAGHFRSGLHVSTGTAVTMSQLLLEEQVELDLEPFRLHR